MTDKDTIKIKAHNATYYIHRDFAADQVFVCSVPRRMVNGEGDVLHAGRNEVRRVEEDGLQRVVKRYKRVNLVQSVIYSFFRRTKAQRAYDYARVFRERGIDTPREVAYIEQREHGLFTTGYFISLYCPHPPIFKEIVETSELNKRLADAVTAFILEMHRKGILHGDLNFGNFLYDEQADGSIRFAVIDINRSHFCTGMPTREQCLRNLSTTTHRRDLYEYIVRCYARLRGWNEDDACTEALGYLEALEEKQRAKDRLKHKLKK